MGARDLLQSDHVEAAWRAAFEQGRREKEARRRAGFVVDVPQAESIREALHAMLLEAGIGLGREWRALSYSAICERVAQLQDDAMHLDLGGPSFFLPRKGKPLCGNYQVRWEMDDDLVMEQYTAMGGGFFSSYGVGLRVSFLTALRVSGELSARYKEYAGVRVLLLEEDDGTDVIERGRSGVVYAPRVVVVWRGGVVDPAWRLVPGRRAEAVRRRNSAPRAVVLPR
jgi:hypothetical protein